VPQPELISAVICWHWVAWACNACLWSAAVAAVEKATAMHNSINRFFAACDMWSQPNHVEFILLLAVAWVTCRPIHGQLLHGL